MLILTRRVGEALHIGGNVIVRVLESNGSQIRIGIDAPRSVVVTREELLDDDQKVNGNKR